MSLFDPNHGLMRYSNDPTIPIEDLSFPRFAIEIREQPELRATNTEASNAIAGTKLEDIADSLFDYKGPVSDEAWECLTERILASVRSHRRNSEDVQKLIHFKQGCIRYLILKTISNLDMY